MSLSKDAGSSCSRCLRMSEPSERFLPYGRQEIDEDDIAAVAAVLRGDWLTTGPAVEAFEAALAARTQAKARGGLRECHGRAASGHDGARAQAGRPRDRAEHHLSGDRQCGALCRRRGGLRRCRRRYGAADAGDARGRAGAGRGQGQGRAARAFRRADGRSRGHRRGGGAPWPGGGRGCRPCDRHQLWPGQPAAHADRRLPLQPHGRVLVPSGEDDRHGRRRRRSPPTIRRCGSGWRASAVTA